MDQPLTYRAALLCVALSAVSVGRKSRGTPPPPTPFVESAADVQRFQSCAIVADALDNHFLLYGRLPGSYSEVAKYLVVVDSRERPLPGEYYRWRVTAGRNSDIPNGRLTIEALSARGEVLEEEDFTLPNAPDRYLAVKEFSPLGPGPDQALLNSPRNLADEVAHEADAALQEEKKVERLDDLLPTFDGYSVCLSGATVDGMHMRTITLSEALHRANASLRVLQRSRSVRTFVVTVDGHRWRYTSRGDLSNVVTVEKM